MTKRPPHPNGPDRPQGIGASPTRREDDRFMRGRGEYVGNVRMVGTPDVAFVRSPVAHGHIVGIGKPAGFEHAVGTLADLNGVKPIVANSGLPGFKSSEQPAFAGPKVRPVGRILPGPHKVRPHPVACDYEKPSAFDDAIRFAAASDGRGRLMPGNQSRGPMMNLRLAQPDRLIDLHGIGALRECPASFSACADRRRQTSLFDRP
ncbi:FAD binding domain-containing protein [Paraburkholderia caballeronis]|uniref:Aldehyde oxidase and xanthine dehydrogenase, a/b hammerhead domain n=1 Tax=Paraburkholderia caballeronis TaxID=416943 RepID=A0A1H7SW73_9BURK|nr:FAD binding domain-containing protein [Paraburkholderia caballeronis]PXW25700.1 aldehyde oxidase/xanthine dehydrogenase-like protein [Paraburkholderia caballeronis]PXX01307.1 aldehyde oxidase/xanthine dehydrogenase-like protein [Paraburkholderia caballeronis]RAJ99339.1 aldehyde oxidase/xanthine dehydrogenase-like protein [Paraburkholderia caballeronis]SEE26356.1 Aldehyde oxidase and xanthine dehydrogenase, a/b hammerhead domain [Paraburkholderia caballeronis]SEL76843.1 Aldehyde oxidase and 